MNRPTPGEWFDISGPQYQRLVSLARRRLVGYEHHAEDVISRALERWLAVPTDHPSARIETIITSEAYSLLRSEKRRSDRERKVVTDRSSIVGNDSHVTTDGGLSLLRTMLVEACFQHGIAIKSLDIEVLELLLSGYSLAEICRLLGLSRHIIKRSRSRWQLALAHLFEVEAWT